MQKVISCLQCSDIAEPLKFLAKERQKQKGRGHSLYREILYLAITALGRENIDQGLYIIQPFSFFLISYIWSLESSSTYFLALTTSKSALKQSPFKLCLFQVHSIENIKWPLTRFLKKTQSCTLIVISHFLKNR
jgi:hypothetical protein